MKFKELASLLCAIISHGSLQRWKPSETFCWFKSLYQQVMKVTRTKPMWFMSFQNTDIWEKVWISMRKIFQAWMSVCDRRLFITLHQNTLNNICGFLLFKGNLRSKINPSPLCIQWPWTWSIYGFPLKKKQTLVLLWCLDLIIIINFFFFRIELDKSQAHVRNTCISHSKEIRPNYHQTIRAINQLNLFKFILAKSRVALEEEFKGDFLISIHCMHVVMWGRPAWHEYWVVFPEAWKPSHACE